MSKLLRGASLAVLAAAADTAVAQKIARDGDANLNKPSGIRFREAAPAPTMETLARAVEEMRESNDRRLKEIETRGASDPLSEEKTDKINTAITEIQGQIDEIVKRHNRGGAPADEADPTKDPEYRKQFHSWLKRGDNIDDATRAALEKRAMSAGSNVDGGYITTPEIDTEIARLARTDGTLRNAANVRQISGASFSKPVANNDLAAGWVAELEGRPSTDATTFGGVTINVHEMYAMPGMSQTLLDDAFVNLDAFVAEETNEAFWELEAAAFIDGNGVGKPQGIILPAGKRVLETGNTAAVQGKLGYVKSGATTALFGGATPVADALINLQTRLKSRYRSNARWRLNRFTEAEVRKIKDDNDNYIWQLSLKEGTPNVLLGHPTDIDDHMPDIASGALPMLFGDFRAAYTIVDRIGIRMLRDPYTAKPYVLFYSTKRVGGGYIKTEAMKGLVCAAH